MHVQAKDKYLMEDLSQRKRKEIREREREKESEGKNRMGRKTMEKVGRGRIEPSFGRKRDKIADRGRANIRERSLW